MDSEYELTKQENLALWLGITFTFVPGLVVAGFFPDFDVLPKWGWMGIAALGSLVAGAIGARHRILGGLTGAVAGLGVIVGIVGYSAIRNSVLPTETMLRLEIAVGAMIGATPGLIAYFKLARRSGD